MINNIIMTPQFIESERGNKLLLLENCKFSKVSRPLASGLFKWRCVNKTCKAFVKTFGENTNIVEQNLDHNHDTISDQNIQRQILSVTIKRKAVEDIKTSPNKLMCKTIKDIPVQSKALQVGDLLNIKRNLYNARRKNLLPLPNHKRNSKYVEKISNEKKIKMSDGVSVSDVVCVDDMGKARVMEPILADKVSSLKEQCTIFLNDIEHYHEAVDKFISVMDNLAKQVEQEKRNGIIVSNKLASLSNKFKEDLAVLQEQIEQKTLELDRYKIEHRSLQKIESEQTDLINQLSFQN